MAADVDTIDSLFERYGNVYRWLVTLTVMIGAIAMGFATSMVNVAVPAVMGAYGVGLDQAQWMATGFLATMSTTMLLSSWPIEVLGQRVTAFYNVGSAIGSLISATAPNIDLLVIGRVLQGRQRASSAAGNVFDLQSLPAGRRGMARFIWSWHCWRRRWPHSRRARHRPYQLPSVLPAAALLPAGDADVFDLHADQNLACKLPPFDWTGFLLMFVATFLLLAGLSNGQRWGWDWMPSFCGLSAVAP